MFKSPYESRGFEPPREHFFFHYKSSLSASKAGTDVQLRSCMSRHEPTVAAIGNALLLSQFYMDLNSNA